MSDQAIPISEILNRAADLIQERGWAQGDWTQAPTQGLCLVTAIGRVLDSYDFAENCVPRNAVREYLGLGARPIFLWNDAPGRTASEVIEVLRATAAIEQARESSPAEVSA